MLRRRGYGRPAELKYAMGQGEPEREGSGGSLESPEPCPGNEPYTAASAPVCWKRGQGTIQATPQPLENAVAAFPLLVRYKSEEWRANT